MQLPVPDAGWRKYSSGGDRASSCSPCHSSAERAGARDSSDAGCRLSRADGSGCCNNTHAYDCHRGRRSSDRNIRGAGYICVAGLGGVGNATSRADAGWRKYSTGGDRASGCSPCHGGAERAGARDSSDAGCRLSRADGSGCCNNTHTCNRGLHYGSSDCNGSSARFRRVLGRGCFNRVRAGDRNGRWRSIKSRTCDCARNSGPGNRGTIAAGPHDRHGTLARLSSLHTGRNTRNAD